MKNMMLNKLTICSLILVSCFCFATTAKAAGEKFFVTGMYQSSGTRLSVTIAVNDGIDLYGVYNTSFLATGITDEAGLRTAVLNAVVAWAINSGWSTATTDDVIWLRPTFNYNDLLNKPTRTFNNNVSRTLNSSYTVNTTRDACLSYSINATWSLSALLSGSGSAFLEYSVDSGTTWITVNQVSKSLNLLTVAGSDDMNLTGCVPANALVRLRTTSSNMTVGYVRGQEMLN